MLDEQTSEASVTWLAPAGNIFLYVASVFKIHVVTIPSAQVVLVPGVSVVNKLGFD